MLERANFEYFWEGASTISAFLSIVFLLIIPIYFIRITKKYLKGLSSDQADQISKYDKLFESYKKNRGALMYQSVFFLRRYSLLSVITVLNFNPLLQVQL